MKPHSVHIECGFFFLEPALTSASFGLFGIDLEVSTDDRMLMDELRLILGTGERLLDYSLAPRSVRVRVETRQTSNAGTIVVEGDDLSDAADFLLSFGSATIPLRPVEGRPNAVALDGLDEPLFVFERRFAHFLLVPRWRRILANFLMLRILRFRTEFLFFHAASLNLGKGGVMLVGMKGTGKSTLSLALAVRGHGFLGDEMAVYNPADGMLLPFRRPVGIKPGPRSAAVQSALNRVAHFVDEDGMMRVPIEDILDVIEPAHARLQSVVFLDGFGANPTMHAIDAGRQELALMQPIATALQEGTKVSRVFEMIRLLSRCRCYRLKAAAPDETAALVERELLHAEAQ